MEYMRRFHRHEIGSNQCNSFIAKHVRAPLQNVSSDNNSKHHLVFLEPLLGHYLFCFFNYIGIGVVLSIDGVRFYC